MQDYIVVGSGLTGTLAAQELLAAGRSVLMLDIGEEPDAGAFQLLRAASARAPQAVSAALIRSLAAGGGSRGRPGSKTWFGDQTLMRWKKHWELRFENCAEVGPATLRGGYSRVWGASCMPPELLERLGRTLSPEAAAPLSREVLEFLGAEEPPRSPRRPTAVEGLLGRFAARGSATGALRAMPSLLAMERAAPDCIRCGNCLLGCPVDRILCASVHVDRLRRHPGFRYLGQQRCTGVSESAMDATARCVDLSSGERTTFSARRILLAAGPLATTGILCDGRQYGGEVRLLTSQLFSFPFFSPSVGDLLRTRGGDFGLCRAYLYDSHAPRPASFLQLYDSNQVLRYYAGGRSWSVGAPGRIAGALLDRIAMACQGYLDSDQSPALFFTAGRDGSGSRLRGAPAAPKELASIAAAQLKGAGYLPGPITMHRAADGVHFGGSFPMRAGAGAHSSDALGRPAGAARIHAVDASVLPFIPAGPFTSFSLFNTLRIVRDLARLPA